MSLKRILVALVAIVTLCIFTIPTFAFYNPGYDEEQELFPGSPVTPWYSSVEQIRTDVELDALDVLYTEGYQEWYNKQQNGFVILNQDLTYYQEQLTGPTFEYYLSMTLSAESLGGVGKSARMLIEPIKMVYRKADGGLTDYMSCGWSFQFDFTKMECIISPAYGGTIEPITDYTLRLPCEVGSYESTDGHTIFVASLDVRFLLNGEAETCKLYTRDAGNYIYRDILRNDSFGQTDLFNVRYLTYDIISGNVGDHFIIRNIKIGDNLDGQYFFDAGYAEGYADGERDGKNEMVGKLDEEYWKGYNEGKRVGELNVQVSELSIPDIFDNITGSIITLFKSIFGFEIFGINVSALIGSIAVVAVVAWLIRKLVK